MADVDQSDDLENRKGDEIKLLAGTAKKYSGYVHAWLDQGLPPTAQFYQIIVEMPDKESPPNTRLISRKASKNNVKRPSPPATTYTQAAFEQIPQLEQRLADFAKMIAKCRVPMNHELSDIIREAIQREVINLMNKGSSAEYRLVDTSGLPNVVEPDQDGQEQ